MKRRDLVAERLPGKRGQQRHRVRPLHRDQGRLRRDVARLTYGGDVVLHPGEVLCDAAGVDDDDVVVGGAAVDDAVVDDAAVGVAHGGVHRLAVGELAHVVGDQALDRLGGAGALQHHLAHVRHVEGAGALADRLVLLDDSGVLHRHLPAGEGDDAGTEGTVGLEERGALQHG